MITAPTGPAHQPVERQPSRAPHRAPTVSVVIPCGGTASHLPAALESIKSQEGQFRLHDIIVVDDGVTGVADRNLLDSLRQWHGVRVIANNRTPGPAGARNAGVEASQSQWIAFLDADDVWLPGSLAARFQAMAEFPDARFISGDFQIWYPETGTREPNFFRTRPYPATFYGAAYRAGIPIRLERPILTTLSTTLCSSCGVLVDRGVFEAVGGYEESLRFKEDVHLWFKLSHLTDLILVPQAVFLYRQHTSNMTHADRAPFDYERVLLDFVRRTEARRDVLAYTRQRYPRGYARNARWYRQHRCFRAGCTEALKGLNYDPFCVAAWRQLIASLLRRA